MKTDEKRHGPGLLNDLKSITSTQHVSILDKQRVAIDGYGLIHRGMHSCSEQLAKGQHTDGVIRFVMKCVHVIRESGGTKWYNSLAMLLLGGI